MVESPKLIAPPNVQFSATFPAKSFTVKFNPFRRFRFIFGKINNEQLYEPDK